ncbi:hypothetical protein J6590_076561 [Homalodisca vitripennis]|nr:hypothetical protein J6590_076561 [Homalodisca vitripennis]
MIELVWSICRTEVNVGEYVFTPQHTAFSPETSVCDSVKPDRNMRVQYPRLESASVPL